MLVSLFRKCCIIACEIASMESSLILILILEFEYLHNTFNKWRTFLVSISIVLNSIGATPGLWSLLAYCPSITSC